MNFILLLLALRITESKKHLRIIGGRDAEENEYPYVARFEILQWKEGNIFRRSHLCTSTILTPDWTLTAAHCEHEIYEFDNGTIKKRPFADRRIIWFGHFLAAATKDAYSDVLYVIKHPRTIIINNLLINDIALVRTQPIKIKEYGKLSAVDAKSLIGQEVHVVGYGYTNSSDGKIGNTMTLRKPLQVIKVIIKSCSENDDGYIYPKLCLASPCGVWGSIVGGDSGGPVIHPSGVVAINTAFQDFDYSSEADRTITVGSITSTSPFIDWIWSVRAKYKT